MTISRHYTLQALGNLASVASATRKSTRDAQAAVGELRVFRTVLNSTSEIVVRPSTYAKRATVIRK